MKDTKSKIYNHRDSIPESQLVSNASIDAKIAQLVNQARIRQSYKFLNEQTHGDATGRPDFPVPRHFKAKLMPTPKDHENGTK